MNKSMKYWLLALGLLAHPTLAATPSPAMAAQFKNLSPAEQQRVAAQYGVSLPEAQTSSSEHLSRQAEPQQLQPIVNAIPAVKESERFGMNLFNSKISTFAPIDNAPVPQNYRLGPDDTVLVQFFGKTNESRELVVGRDGAIYLGELGPVTVNGLTFSEAENLLRQKVSEVMIGTEVALTMGKLKTINVFVAGEATTPGMFAVSGGATMTQVLYLAGGVTEIGSLRSILLKRAGKTVSTFDLYDLLLRGDSSGDRALQHGDVIFVEPLKAVAKAQGQVKRPAIYEIKHGDTVDTLLSMAGGASAGAYPKSVVLERIIGHLPKLTNLDLTQAANKQLALKDGDVLRIASTSPHIENRVTLAGAVVRPGHYAWEQGQRVSHLINSLWSNLHLSADLDYALLVRETNIQGDIEVYHFNLANAVNQPNSLDDLALKPRDIILVFHHAQQSHDRAALNDYLREKLLERLNNNEQMKWALTDDLAKIAFAQLQVDNIESRKAAAAGMATATIAGQTIRDKNSLEMTSLSRNSVQSSEVLFEDASGKEALPQEMARVLRGVYTDRELLELSASLNRTELLFPLLERLRLQARTGQNAALARVNGEVRVPGIYPLVQNPTITSLVLAAGGLTESAYLGRAELTRARELSHDRNGVEVKNLVVNLHEELQGSAQHTLQSRDHLTVFKIPDWNVEQSIEVRGEVRFPGRYTIQRGELLSQVLARAGGLTSNAFIDGSIFTRVSMRERERLQLQKMSEQLRTDIATRSLAASNGFSSPTSAHETLLMINQIENQQTVGRLVIDLAAITQGSDRSDLQLEDGDLLYIPRQDFSVSVVGEVQHVSSHRYQESLSYKDYLSLAGGTRKRADDDRTYIIKANGSVVLPQSSGWFAVNKVMIEPGDTIVVPVDTEYRDGLSLWTAITQIFYQSAVALAALNSF